MVDAFQDLSVPDLFIDDDLTFTSDSAVITFGADGDTTLTHTDGSGLTLNSTNKIMFNDASQFIQGSSATVLSLGATDEIDLTATLIDINGNADVSGTVTAGGLTVDGASTINISDSTAYSSTSRANGFLQINNTNTTSGVFSGLELIATGTGSAGAAEIFCIDTGSGSGDLAFSTRNGGTWGEKVRILADGNVGIGTSSPVTLKSSTTLQVDGNAKLGDDNGRGLLSLGDIASTGANAGIWRGAAGAYAGTGNFLNLGGYDGITFTTGNADISSQTERMRIDSNGNLLVGTTTHRNFSGNTTEITVGTASTGATAGGAITFDSGSGFLGYLGFQESEGTLGTLTSTPLVFTTGNTERMRIDSSGNVGINTTDIGANLSVRGDASTGVINVLDVGNNQNAATTGDGARIRLHCTPDENRGVAIGNLSEANFAVNNSMVFYTSTASTLSEKMRLDSSGNLLVGRNSRLSNQVESISSDTVMSVHGVLTSHQTACGVFQYTADALQIRAYGATAGTGKIQFKVGGGGGGADSEAARINSDGNFLVGKTSNSVAADGTFIQQDGKVHVTAGSNYPVSVYRSNGNGRAIGFYSGTTLAGWIEINSTSAISINNSSDQRLKENIADADDAGSKIDAIQVRKFDWIADGLHQDYGMVAQELVTVAPEAVSVPEDPNEMMGVDYSKLVPMLVKEIQSLRARVQQLENN